MVYDEASLLAVLLRGDAGSFHRGGNRRPENIIAIPVLFFAAGGVDPRTAPKACRSLERTP